MYDTIKLYQKFEYGKPNIDDVMAQMQSIKEITYDTGNHIIQGTYKGIRVNYNEHTMSVSGSIAKYHYGNNLETLTMSASEVAIQSLSDLIGFDLSNSIVSRVDFSSNMLTQYKPKYYYNFLGHLSRYNRFDNGDTLYYNQQSKNLLFYDKIKEAKKKQMPIPNEYLGKNVLRYELAIKKELAKFCNRTIKVKDLYTRDIYNLFLYKWQEIYTNIDKQKNNIEIMQKHIEKPKHFDSQLLTGLVQKVGYTTIENLIEQMKLTKTFQHKEYYSRLKSKYRKMAKQEIDNADVINEINTKVNDIVLMQEVS